MAPLRGETRKLFQLVGELDREHPANLQPGTFSRYRLAGTDVGALVDFGPDRDMLILFGDSWTGTWTDGHTDVAPSLPDLGPPPHDFFAAPYRSSRPFNADAIAIVSRDVNSSNVDSGFRLDFFADGDGYTTLEVPRVNMLSASVPTGALGLRDGRALLFVTGVPFTTGPPVDPPVQRSWIALWDKSGPTTDEAWEFSASKFANFLCPVIGDQNGVASDVGMTGVDDAWIWLWGTGFKARETPVYLARARLDQVVANPADRTAWEFFTGSDDDGRPRFEAWLAPGGGPAEAHAAPLFAGIVGEYSVYYDRFLETWLMLDAPNARDGVVCRSAPNPWGPWDDEGVVIFDPRREPGYGQFIHDHGPGDRLNDPLRDERGGIYAPIVIPRFAERTDAGSKIRYMLSTWNPYTVVLMESEIRLA
jgi:hypothetical protein